MAKKKSSKNNNNYNKPNFYKRDKCYICGGKLEEKEIVYENLKWGGGEKFPEKATANVCVCCGVRTFSAFEAKRLQELSRQY